jgi:cobalamin biosynthesis Mg chelatase CobN
MPQPPSPSPDPSANSDTKGGHPANYSAASVPMSVYRELAAELQATQAMLDALNVQHQQLTRQNQQLTQQKQRLQAEVVNVVNATLNMRQVAESFQERPDDISPAQAKVVLPPAGQPEEVPTSPVSFPIAGGVRGVGSTFEPGSSEPQALYTEQEGGFERWSTPSFADDPGERSGLWLLVAIVATVVTAFGAGYWLVRPLIQGGQGR